MFSIATISIIGIFLLGSKNISDNEYDKNIKLREDILKGRIYRAKRIAKKEIKRNPQNLDAHSWLAIVYTFKGKDKKAFEEAQFVLKQRDDLNMYWILFGYYFFNNKNEEKLEIVKTMFNKYPNDIDVNFLYLEHIIMPNKDYQEACKLIYKILDQDILKTYSKEKNEHLISFSMLGIPSEKYDLEYYDNAAQTMLDQINKMIQEANCNK
jgi:tetratricopeptide (TPR) repeat protein